MPKPEDIPVFLLCGGLGTRLREQTDLRPKPMIEVGGKPILWHIMRSYAHHGFRRFVLCLGYKSEVVKQYFLNYASMNSDFSVSLSDGSTTVHSRDHGDNWEVTLAYTGELAMTGARVARAAAKYLGDAEHFAVSTVTASPTPTSPPNWHSIGHTTGSGPCLASIRHPDSASSCLTAIACATFKRSPIFARRGSTAATSCSAAAFLGI